MDVKIEASWKEVLKEEFEKEYFRKLVDFVKEEYRRYNCLPKGSEIFNAYNTTPFDQVKVVILGQDPYPTPGHAHGLCFSVQDHVKPFPGSLVNIFRELQDDLKIPFPQTGNLTRWAKQGVFLLNVVLTVRAGQPKSHAGKGWEQFTTATIRKISEQKENVVFMLWGNDAKKKIPLIDSSKHLILTSGHPSPLSANKGYWFGNRHFSQANVYLETHNLTPIKW